MNDKSIIHYLQNKKHCKLRISLNLLILTQISVIYLLLKLKSIEFNA
jgi:hypothetical protein